MTNMGRVEELMIMSGYMALLVKLLQNAEGAVAVIEATGAAFEAEVHRFQQRRFAADLRALLEKRRADTEERDRRVREFIGQARELGQWLGEGK